MKTYLKQCRWGHFLLLHNDMISQHMDRYGEWSETEVDLFRALLPADGICVEVGSNIGAHALALSAICPEGKVFCFEPQRPIFHILCANAALNNRLNIRTRHAAVADRSGTITIDVADYEAPWNYGSFSVEKGFNTERAFLGAVKQDDVDLIALDEDQTLRNIDRLDLIKIDAEGYELKVLRGARNLIKRHRPDLFIEFSAEHFDDVFSEMRAMQYTGYWFLSLRVRDDNFNGRALQRDDVNWESYQAWDANMLFRRQGRKPPGELAIVRAATDVEQGLRVYYSFHL